MSTDYKLKQVYSFKVYPAALLGNNFDNVTVIGIVDREGAAGLIDPVAMHIRVYPTLPAGTPNSPDGYNYLKIRMPNGTVTVLGIAWIKDDSVVLVQAQTIIATVNGANAEDAAKVRNALVALGFNDVSVKVVSASDGNTLT